MTGRCGELRAGAASFRWEGEAPSPRSPRPPRLHGPVLFSGNSVVSSVMLRRSLLVWEEGRSSRSFFSPLSVLTGEGEPVLLMIIGSLSLNVGRGDPPPKLHCWGGSGGGMRSSVSS